MTNTFHKFSKYLFLKWIISGTIFEYLELLNDIMQYINPVYSNNKKGHNLFNKKVGYPRLQKSTSLQLQLNHCLRAYPLQKAYCL